jgi:anti-sigma regulatory factor (Ser/Thr protein kinase)
VPSIEGGEQVELSVRVEAATGPEVVGAARALLRTMLELWDCDDPDDAGVLLTSEIVTNAVRHAAGVLAMQMDLSLADGMVRVAVEDCASAVPRPIVVDHDSVGGRGLVLVEALASRWGSTPTDRGKVVWFEFPVNYRGSGARDASV